MKLTLSAQNTSSDVKVITYSKAIYDDSKNNVWDPPTTTDMGAQTLPLKLTLAPWSMNVVIIKYEVNRSNKKMRETHIASPVLSLSRRLPHLIPTTIESGPTRCSTRVSRNPASFIHLMQSAPV